jgi:copper chaperone CopZ
MKSVTLSVPDMKCGGCARAVGSALSKLDSVKRADVSLESKTVSVDFDDGSPLQALIDAIAAAGYRASLID